jgi:hypothetical protein
VLRIGAVEHEGRRLGEVVVWLGDIRVGKPLPVVRRYALDNDRCLLVPRVQAAVAGGTLNVRSADALVHRTRFVRLGAIGLLVGAGVGAGVGTLVDTIATVEHNDAGQVVPLERVLARPGLVEARSVPYAWMRAWIQVFDHPYFVVTAGDGRFVLDSIPAGQYHLAAWHPRFGVRDTVVSVVTGKATEVRVTY